MAIISKIICL